MPTRYLRDTELALVNGDYEEIDADYLAVIEQCRRWALQQIPDHAGEPLPNCMRVGYEQRSPIGALRIAGAVDEYIGQTIIGTELPADQDTTPLGDDIGTEKRLQTTRAAFGLQALCREALLRPQAIPELRDGIERIARRLYAFQYRTPDRIMHGSFKGGPTDGTATAHGTAACGMAMLLAYKVLERSSFLIAARDAANFLLRITVPEDGGTTGPNVTWLDEYDVEPLTDPQPGHVCDKVSQTSTSDTLYTTGTNWNIYAALFLQEIADYFGSGAGEAGETYAPYAALIRDYFAPLILDGYSFIAPVSIDDSHVATTWAFDSDHDWNDGQMHRSGEVAGKTTFGNDGICYGIDALWRTDYPIAEVKAAYEAYALAPHGGGVFWGELDSHGLPSPEPNQFDFAAGYDGRVCWPPYFRGEPGGEEGSAILRGYGAQYDVWKAGWLLPFQKANYPEHYNLALSLALRAVHIGTSAKANLDTYRNTVTGKYDWFLKGTRPVMQTMYGLIDALAWGR